MTHREKDWDEITLTQSFLRYSTVVEGGGALEGQNTEFRIQNTENRIQNTEYRIQNTEYRIQNAEYRLQLQLNSYQILYLMCLFNAKKIDIFNTICK